MMGFGLIFVILIVGAIAYGLGWRPENLNIGGQHVVRGGKTPLEILKERYANGEITKDEYESVRAGLER